MDDLRQQYAPLRRAMLKTERVILHFFLDAVPATADELRREHVTRRSLAP